MQIQNWWFRYDLRRSVFIVGRDGKLTYVNYFLALGNEPNYEEVIAEAKKALR
jgi:peroxiredoxin